MGVGTSRASTDVYSTGARNTLDAMHSNGAAKLAVISAVPAGPWEEQPWLQRRIALPLLQRFFGPLAKGRAITYADLAAALLDSLTRRDLYRHASYVAN